MTVFSRMLAWPAGLWAVAQAAMCVAKWARPGLPWWLMLWPTWLATALVAFVIFAVVAFCYCPCAFDDVFRIEEDEK